MPNFGILFFQDIPAIGIFQPNLPRS